MAYTAQIMSIALQNKYTKWYCSIVSRAQLQASTRKSAKEILGYTKKHHIRLCRKDINNTKDGVK
jgi:hypothetical protein